MAEQKAVIQPYKSVLGGKPTYLYRGMFENDPDAVVCEYVREISFEEIEERAYIFFTNTAHMAPKTLHVVVGFEPWGGLYPS